MTQIFQMVFLICLVLCAARQEPEEPKVIGESVHIHLKSWFNASDTDSDIQLWHMKQVTHCQFQNCNISEMHMI